MRSHETPPALLIKDWLDLAIHIAAEHKTIMALFNSIGVVGIVVFSVLGVCWADYWPGDTEFQTICRTIIDEVNSNQIRRRGREFINRRYEIVVHETMTQRQLCDRLVIQHNTHNYDYLGIVSSDECFGTLNSPDFYSSASWNNWRGRHCGHWRSTGNGVVGSPERDDALWEYAHLSYGVYYRQNVDFFQRPPCCQDGWNESGGTVSTCSESRSVIGEPTYS